MSIVIEKGVGVPLRGSKNNLALAAALRTMEVGDSFVLPIGRRGSAAALGQRLNPKKFATRREGELFRTWRTA